MLFNYRSYLPPRRMNFSRCPTTTMAFRAVKSAAREHLRAAKQVKYEYFNTKAMVRGVLLNFFFSLVRTWKSPFRKHFFLTDNTKASLGEREKRKSHIKIWIRGRVDTTRSFRFMFLVESKSSVNLDCETSGRREESLDEKWSLTVTALDEKSVHQFAFLVAVAVGRSMLKSSWTSANKEITKQQQDAQRSVSVCAKLLLLRFALDKLDFEPSENVQVHSPRRALKLSR